MLRYIRYVMGFSLIDHTADVGVKVWAEDLGGLFEEAARALFSLITSIEEVRPRVKREVESEGNGWEELLVGWLSELLYLHEVEGLLFSRFEIKELHGDRLKGEASGEEIDPRRHPIQTGVKAVTYHQLRVERKDGLWEAQIIFDI